MSGEKSVDGIDGFFFLLAFCEFIYLRDMLVNTNELKKRGVVFEFACDKTRSKMRSS